MTRDDTKPTLGRARERRMLLALGLIRAAASVAIPILGRRIPAPFRIEAAFSDAVAAAAVLLFRHQGYK